MTEYTGLTCFIAVARLNSTMKKMG